jgi:hypothetical protein
MEGHLFVSRNYADYYETLNTTSPGHVKQMVLDIDIAAKEGEQT